MQRSRNGYNIEFAKQLGLEKKLKLLSTEYKYKHAPLNWECLICGEKFFNALSNIEYTTISQVEFEKIGNTIKCPECRNNYILNYFKKLVSQHINEETGQKAELLTNKFTKTGDKYIIKCENNHKWSASLNMIILNNRWCPYCSHHAKLTIEEMQAMAKSRKGECLSDVYINSWTKLKWKCHRGHVFEMTPNKIKKLQWCPECEPNSTSISEKIVRLYFEVIFGKEFKKIRPEWLLNNNGYKMELDGYCEELNMAFEHNGLQHYKIVNKFKMTDNDLQQRQNDDELKKKLCIDHGIKLIIIPALFDVLNVKDLKNHIKNECILQGVVLPSDFDSIDIDYNVIYINDDCEKALNDLKKIANEKGGAILSDKYINCILPITCCCKIGHIFESTATNIKSGYWCPYKGCNPTLKKELKDVQEFAESVGFECISNEYINQRTDMEFKCKICGHVINRSFKMLQIRNQCIQCKINSGKFRRWTIEDMKKIAKERNGECLSNEYKNNHSKLEWECNICNHKWFAIPSNIISGGWCPNYKNHK